MHAVAAVVLRVSYARLHVPAHSSTVAVSLSRRCVGDADPAPAVLLPLQIADVKAAVVAASEWEAEARSAVACAEAALSRQSVLLRLSLEGRNHAAGESDGAASSSAAAAASGSSAAVPQPEQSSESHAASTEPSLALAELRELLRVSESLAVIPPGEELLRRSLDAAVAWLNSFLSIMPDARSWSHLPAVAEHLATLESKPKAEEEKPRPRRKAMHSDGEALRLCDAPRPSCCGRWWSLLTPCPYVGRSD